MTNPLRPEALPFGAPVQIGLPYHGLCRNGLIGTTAYPQPTGSNTIAVQHPKHAAPHADQNTNHVWQEYAILSGTTREIGGQSLDDDKPSQFWLYCDANYTWVMSFDLVKSGIEQTLQIWLERPFGILPDKPQMTRRLLATSTYTPKTYSGANQSSTVAAYTRRFYSSHDKTGAISYVNVAAYNANQPWTKTAVSMPISEFAVPFTGIHDEFKVTISGNGSLVSGQVGVGISAAINHVATAPDMLVSESSSSADDGTSYGTITEEYFESPPTYYPKTIEPRWGSPLDYVASFLRTQSSSFQRTVNFFRFVTAAGVETSLTISELTELEITHEGSTGGSVTISDPGSGPVGTMWWYAERNYSYTRLINFSFAGLTHSFSFAKTGTPTSVYQEEVDDYLAGGTFDLPTPNISEYSCAMNGSAASCDSGVYVADVSNNILQVYDYPTVVSVALLPADGDKETPASIIPYYGATIDPMTGELTTSATDQICYV